ncbi:MAG: aminotransferase class V-fold PLP-dependent enzyme, partial [Chloroflexi bacterium]|nr:aminotransferase class V-fold PLP-dependent enzyme [Chloroflexota bacterium]
MPSFDVDSIRARFPALSLTHEGRPMAFFDGPGGTQVPDTVIDAVSRYYRDSNANAGGDFLTSRRSDAVVAEAHAALADLLGAESPAEIKLGANMTSLTLHVSRSITAAMEPGDEIVVTRLDHEANVGPWLSAAADRGLTVRTVD